MWTKPFSQLLVLTSLALGCRTPAPPTPAQHHPLALTDAPKTLIFDRATPPSGIPQPPVLDLLASEAQRMGNALSTRTDTPLHFLAFEVTDTTVANVSATHGAIVTSFETQRRTLDVDVRVGSPLLDNTHPNISPSYYQGSSEIALDHSPDALRNALWLETDQAYKRASKELIEVRAQHHVGIAVDPDVPDFSTESPIVHIEAPIPFSLDRSIWEQRVRNLSNLFRTHERILHSFVHLGVSVSTRSYASTEGHRVHTARNHARISFGASTTATDGTEISRTDSIDAHDIAQFPEESVLRSRIQAVISELDRLEQAPIAEPFTGPAILEGKAAAVFFHEVFGHRVEGHRQKGDVEGQTFFDQLNRPIMASAFDVFDDPTVRSVNGIDLNGHYLVDSEGVRGQRAPLITDGVFVGFLMSRMPVRGVAQSNGHGRREPGYRPVARQANLFVDPARVTTRNQLDRDLLDEVKRQGKPYGIIVGEVSGGYATTQRSDPQAFLLEPTLVFRLHPDERREMVRGVSIEGTPLSVLAGVVAAANDFAVFNGYCGAESGEVPASAVSPSLLVRQVELTRQQTTRQRPPLLPPPRDVPSHSLPPTTPSGNKP